MRGGARFSYLAVEASYSRLGDWIADAHGNPLGDFDERAVGGRAWSASCRSPVDLYARVGYARTELKATARERPDHVDERFKAYYGAGARWNVTRELGVFAEYQRHDKLDLDAYFVGMQWRF